MRRRCRAARLEPLSLIVQQRCLFLGARDRDAEVFVAVQAERCLGQIAQHFLDSGIIDGLPLDRGAVDPFACSIGDELQSAHAVAADRGKEAIGVRSEEHTSELQSLMRISYAVFCLKKKKEKQNEQ